MNQNHKFKIGDAVEKTTPGAWRGTVCGTFTSTTTPVGYVVESTTEQGTVLTLSEAELRPMQSDAASHHSTVTGVSGEQSQNTNNANGVPQSTRSTSPFSRMAKPSQNPARSNTGPARPAQTSNSAPSTPAAAKPPSGSNASPSTPAAQPSAKPANAWSRFSART